MSKIYDVAIIGGGSAGVMAALRTVLNNDETILFPGTGKDKKKSRAMWVTKVENMPGHLEYKKGIENPNRESLNWLSTESDLKDKFTWLKNRGVTEVKKNGEVFELTDNKGEVYQANYVILCTGVMDVQPKIDGDIEPVFPYANNQTIDYCLRCDGHHVYGKKTGIIGHTNGAGWVAAMLYERYKTPQMMIFTHGEAPELDDEVKDLIERYGIEVYEGEIFSIKGDTKTGKLEGFEVEGSGIVEVEMSFVSLGMIVYNELAKKLGAEVDERGFVITNGKGETNIEGLYVAGDLRAGVKKQIYTAWDTAVDSADDINARIRRRVRNS
ncbi:NAD(P)/FAD-dependent oxidoreductase [Halobacteriovorax sp. JY17]|uniref:NAD(P)/FAD-dependent oxidoreductase n=1 Tax=Halobacteriovorax sp. JY17 TaxID=2014617 RepID=UPI000C358EEA|nr:NAD(P)/FAD-dependent oxidoreductase [Halobacteriovorax sp. JY17]PIK14074.1 MAG: thioredoxin [Halobacteriovorax sp. JY17]